MIRNNFRFEDDYEDSLQNIINNNAGVGDSADPSTFAYPQPYCGYMNRMPTACFEERYCHFIFIIYSFQYIYSIFFRQH